MITLTKKPTVPEIQERIAFLQAQQTLTAVSSPYYSGNCHGITIYLLNCQEEIIKILQSKFDRSAIRDFKNQNYLDPFDMEKFLEERTAGTLDPLFGDITGLSAHGRILHTGIYVESNRIFNKLDHDRGWGYISMQEYENYVRRRYTHYSKDKFDWRFYRLK